MRDETAEQPAPLRSGFTTGSGARATSLAAARLLLGGDENIALGDIVRAHGRQFALTVAPEGIEVECFAIDRQGRIVDKAQ
jgi:cobalt-precorrin-5B (C1)-methyltransferase